MARYLLRVRQRFEAAHHLTSYRGRPEPNHGHSWLLEATLAADELDDEGIAFDFVAVKEALRRLTAGFDHRDINTVAPFDRLSPTTERLAEWFHRRLAEELPAATIVEVTLWEGPDCAATYRPG